MSERALAHTTRRRERVGLAQVMAAASGKACTAGSGDATPDGWTVDGMLQKWRFRVEVVADGLRLTAQARDDHTPAIWTVTAR